MSKASDELIAGLIETLVADFERQGFEWNGITLVGRVHASGSSRVHGYRYFDATGWEAVGPDNAIEALQRLRAINVEMAAGVGTSWKNCLIQISKPDYAFAIDFEYEDETRWIGGAGTYDSLTEHVMSLRPIKTEQP